MARHELGILGDRGPEALDRPIPLPGTGQDLAQLGIGVPIVRIACEHGAQQPLGLVRKTVDPCRPGARGEILGRRPHVLRRAARRPDCRARLDRGRRRGYGHDLVGTGGDGGLPQHR